MFYLRPDTVKVRTAAGKSHPGCEGLARAEEVQCVQKARRETLQSWRQNVAKSELGVSTGTMKLLEGHYTHHYLGRTHNGIRRDGSSLQVGMPWNGMKQFIQ